MSRQEILEELKKLPAEELVEIIKNAMQFLPDEELLNLDS